MRTYLHIRSRRKDTRDTALHAMQETYDATEFSSTKALFS